MATTAEKKNVNDREQTLGEEIANAITHGIGALLAVAGLVILATVSGMYSDAWSIVGVSIYGATLIILYLSSTFYHAFPGPKIKMVFQHLDHASIYILIAGTYTPITLVTLRGPLGWTLFGLIWGMAILGILFSIFRQNRNRIGAVILYIVMGWLALFAVKPLLSMAPLGLLLWILFGGLFYTAGVFFYAWKKIKFHHTVWHLFVLGGSICHFFGILFYVAMD